MSRMHTVRSVLKDFAGMIGQRHVVTHAAAASYRLFFAFTPMFMLLTSLIRFLPVTQEDVMGIFSETIPDSLYQAIDGIVASVYDIGGTVTVLSSVLLLVLASALMRALMKALDEIYGAERRESFLKFAGRAVLYMLLFLLMTLLSLIILVYGKQIVSYLGEQFPDAAIVQALVMVSHRILYLIVGVFLTLAFMLLYQKLPAGKRRFKAQWVGAVFSSAAWLAFSWGFSLYVSVSDRYGAYGVLGTVIIVLMWMYYCLLFFLIGGCINAMRSERGESILKEDNPKENCPAQ